jgi:hypothetical protein
LSSIVSTRLTERRAFGRAISISTKAEQQGLRGPAAERQNKQEARKKRYD